MENLTQTLQQDNDENEADKLYNMTIELNATNQHLHLISLYLQNILANLHIIAAVQIKH